MDTAVALRTLEATYKTSTDAVAVENMIVRLTDKVWLLYLTIHYTIHIFCPPPRAVLAMSVIVSYTLQVMFWPIHVLSFLLEPWLLWCVVLRILLLKFSKKMPLLMAVMLYLWWWLADVPCSSKGHFPYMSSFFELCQEPCTLTGTSWCFQWRHLGSKPPFPNYQIKK